MISLALFPIRLAVSHDLVTTYEALSPWLAGYVAARLEIYGRLDVERVQGASSDMADSEAAVGFLHPEVLAQVVAGALHTHGQTWGLVCELDIEDDLRWTALLVGADGEVLLQWQRQGPQFQVLELIHGCVMAVHLALGVAPSAREAVMLDDVPSRSWPSVCALAMAAATDVTLGEEFVDHKLSCLESARANDPDFAEAVVESSRALRQLGRTASARALVQDFIAAHDEPSGIVYREAVECAVALGDDEQAGALLGALLTRDPFDVLAWRAQADLLLRQHRDDEAIFCLCEAVGLMPERADLSMLLADVLVQRARPKQALEALDLHTNRHGVSPQALRLRARAFAHLHDTQRAEKTLRHLLQLAPDDIEAASDLARHLLADGHPAQASQVLLGALSFAPSDPLVRSELAWTLTLIDDFDAARALISDVDPPLRTALGWQAAVEVALCFQPVGEVDAVLDAVREAGVCVEEVLWWLWGVEQMLRALDQEGAAELCRQRLGQNPPLSEAHEDKKALLLRLDLLTRRLLKHPPPDEPPETPGDNPNDVQTDTYAERLHAMLSIFRHWIEPSTANLLNAAQVQHQQGRSQTAMRWLQEAIERSPPDFYALGLGVMICCECGQPHSAQALMSLLPPETLASDAAHAALDFLEAWVALFVQDWTSFGEALGRVLCHEDLSLTRVGMLVDGVVAAPAAQDVALAVIRQLETPKDVHLKYLRARLLHACGAPDEAIGELQGLLALSPDHCDGHTLAGLIVEQTGQDGGATHWEAAIAADPDKARDALMMLGAHHLRRQETAEAVHCLERCLRLSPGDAYVAQALRAAIAMSLKL